MVILLATGNRHKAAEMRAILEGVAGVEVRTADELSITLPDPVEDGTTLEANAWIKAVEIFNATGLPTIADDTGLEVSALDGAPGVYSARYAGPGATYADNCRKLLDAMSDADDRRARFRTVICFTDGVRTVLAEGSVDGEITRTPDGEGGFGYDPVFKPAESDVTFARMSSEQKNSISHRARALEALRRRLEPLISAEGVS